MSFTYRGLKATLERHIITDAEIDRNIERLQQQNPRIAIIKDRPTQLGDEVVLDYAGFCGEEQFAGGTAEKQTLVLGSGTFIPGFEEQLVDKVPGEKVTVKVTFPQQYHAELAGKDAEFRCVIHEIRVKTAYELDDTFAREVGGCDTFEEMRQRLGQSLQAYADERGEMDLQDQLLRMAADSLEFEVSEDQRSAAVEEQIQILKAQLAQQGLDLNMYCQFMGTTEEKIRADVVPTAENTIRMQAAVDLIVELENLEASQEDIAQACAVIARQNGITVDQLKEHYDAQLESAIIRSVLMSKAMRLLRDTANITFTSDAE